MGINYSFVLRVGYSVSEDDILKKFCQRIDGEYHFEDRFDPKTGQKLKPVEICDKRPYDVIIINGRELDNEHEVICNELADILKCIVEVSGSYCDGNLQYNFAPIGSIKNKNASDYGRIDIRNHTLDYNDVVKMQPELIRLRKRIENIGLEAGEPMVYISSSIG